MSERRDGDPKKDRDAIRVIKLIKTKVKGFNTKRNLSYPILVDFAKATSPTETLKFICEKFVQSKPRRVDLVNMNLKQITRKYGVETATALSIKGFDELKAKYKKRMGSTTP